LVEIDREAAEASIRAWITAHCHLSGGQKAVCCEQIAFALKGRSRGRLRNTVFSHLASDLPLIFWWQGELSPLFEESLYSLIDRFIFDSSRWSVDPLGSFEKIETAVGNSARQLVVQDLAWTRTYHYRLAVAGLFDTPQAQEALPAIASVALAAHPQHRMSALQLVAWLSTQAQWTLRAVVREPAREVITFSNKAGGAVVATVDYAPESAPLGSLEMAGGGMQLRVWREPGSRHLFHRLAVGAVQLDAVAPADSDEDADLIGDQLARGGKNSLYRRTLPRFLELLRI
jgi:glucose-6-phosphate dehydrogenase assembly protein OpcA